MSNKETVNHPGHYNKGGIEVLDIIEAFNLDFSLGNAVKYILRSQYKHESSVEDLQKARFYIERAIEREANNANKEK